MVPTLRLDACMRECGTLPCSMSLLCCVGGVRYWDSFQTNKVCKQACGQMTDERRDSPISLPPCAVGLAPSLPTSSLPPRPQRLSSSISWHLLTPSSHLAPLTPPHSPLGGSLSSLLPPLEPSLLSPSPSTVPKDILEHLGTTRDSSSRERQAGRLAD